MEGGIVSVGTGLNDDADTLHPIAGPASSYHLELYAHILVLFHRRLRVPY